MKIAYLSQSYPPMISGAAMIVQRLAEEMALRGHQVLVLAASDQPYPYSIQKRNLIVNHLPSVQNPFRVGQRFTLWPLQTIMMALHGFAPDILHAHDPFQFSLSSLSYRRWKGVPVVITVHQLPRFVKAYLPNCSLLNRIIIDKCLWAYCSWLARQVNALVAPTRTVADEVLAKTGCSPEVINYGIDPAFFETPSLSPEKDAILRSRLGIPAHVPIVLHVGRLDLDKQVEMVIQAASYALQDHPAHLLVVGDGTERSHLEKLSHEMGVGARSHFPGFITVKDGLPDIYRLASVFITASEIETQGLILQEAQACGLPVVAFNAACIPEVAQDGVHGWLVRPKDVNGLANCLRHLLENSAMAQAMGQAGQKFVQKFNVQNMCDAYEDFYLQTTLQSKSLYPALNNIWSGRAKHYDVSD